MSRYITVQPDATAGGSTLTDLAGPPPVWPAISGLHEVMTASVDPRLQQTDRNDDVTGQGASSAPETLMSRPQVNLETRAFVSQVHAILRNIFKGTAASTGAAPAAIASTIQAAQNGDERCSNIALVREGQVDRVSGVAWNEIELDLPIDGDAKLTATGMGLYHQVDTEAAAALTAPTDAPGGWVYKLRDVEALNGPTRNVLIDCLAGAGFTFTANLDDDPESVFCARKNVYQALIGGTTYRVWYPTHHIRKGKRQVTCRLNFPDTRPDQEVARILAKADSLRLNLYGEPLGTTPGADRRLSLILHRIVANAGDGGAGDLQANDAIRSQYTYGVYLDPATSKDVELELTGTAAVT